MKKQSVTSKDTSINSKKLPAMAATIHITVYEGDRSGKGKYTSDDSYQRNMRIKDYMPFVEKAGFKFCSFLEKGIITISCPSRHAC